MSKRDRNRRREVEPTTLDSFHPIPSSKGDMSPIKPKTEKQKHYLHAIRHSAVTFGIGPAGTGKTFIAVCEAAELLRTRKIEKLIITRPAVEAGESLGFLPGELDEKFDPYFAPVKEILNRRLGAGQTEYLIKAGKIEAKPLAFMRGCTFDNAFVILDEAQNTTPSHMKLFLTRIGQNTRVVVDGDIKQQDIPGLSGLKDAVERFGHRDWCSLIEFGYDDIVRSGIAREIVIGYENPGKLVDVPAFMKHERKRDE